MNGGRDLPRLDAFGETGVGEGQALALRYKGRCCGPVARGLSVSPTVARDRPSPYGIKGDAAAP